MKRGLKIRAVLILLLFVAGCSLISIGYEYSGFYLRHTINGYATFTEEQKSRIRQDVDAYMAWHRRDILPLYVAFLRRIELEVRSGRALAKEDIAGFRQDARMLYQSTLQPTVAPSIDFLLSLSSEQIDELALSLESENRKKHESDLSGSPKEQARKRAARVVQLMENLAGGFEDAQLQMIRERHEILPNAMEIFLRTRADNQQQLMGMLRRHESRDVLAEFLNKWLQTPEILRSSQDQQDLNAYAEGMDQLISELFATLNERQRNKLQGNLVRYAEELAALSKKY